MSEGMLCTLTAMLLAALALICISMIWLMVKGSRSRVTFSFVGCQFSLLLWIISQFIIILSESERQLLIGYDIGNLGISFIGSCWLLFAVSYMDRELSKPLLYGTLGFSSLIFLAAATNPLHRLYYTELSMQGVTHGPLFFVSQIYIYLSMLCGIALVCRQCFENKQRSRGQAVLLTLATAIPLSINLLTLVNVITLDFALTPLSLALSAILVLLATYRYGFLNVNDVAFEDAFNIIEEGVIVFSRQGRITYLSSAAGRMLDISEKTDLDSFISYISDFSESPLTEDFDYAEIEKDGLHLGIKHYHCRDDKGIAVAQLVIVSDISRYYQLIEKTDELAGARQKLAIERERNRIAQEVHDTAGHTFTMISSLAKLSKVRLSEMPESPQLSELRGFMDETESLARGGLTQLRCSINNLREDSFMTTVTAAVKTVTDAVRDIKTELCIQGTEDGRYAFCVQNIYSSFRELITNSVRYSGADRIDVIVKFLDTSLELYVFDNGRGCKEITAHNGLRGISERTEELGGTALFKSGEGIGFSAVIKIPVPEAQKGAQS
ncbi:MAG: histidine kinase N-terminal 7TM domain-containing protein [Huintestinicola sp.]|uniref:sensor histidine kinase n=1 Tax=Huintestinicola sp. TaxID=2981661 RepID=UPI003F12A6E0